MTIIRDRFRDNGAPPRSRAFCSPEPRGPVALSCDRHRAFSRALTPVGGASQALLWHDADVPSKPEVVERRGRRVPAPPPSGTGEDPSHAPTHRPNRDVPA